VNSEYTAIDELDGLTSIVTIFLNVSRLLIFFMIIKWIMQNIHPKNPIFSFSLVIFITIINSLIFFGTNRSDFIFNFAINLIILVYLYKKLGITVNIILISLLPIVVVGMTKYRNSVSITGGANKLVDITDYLQIYLGGVYNVALSLDLKVQNANIFNLLLDISRSAIGPNVILKNMDIVSSSELFNYRIFFSNHMSQIIPMIGQSNLYLGTIFSPILGLAFIFLAVFLTKEIVKVKRMELIYIFTLFSGRIGFVMAQNGNILLNDLTFFLPLFLLLYYLNNKVVIKNE
ncbi:capsule biosynthesis protein CapI, partial [Staphylococcus equorum]